MSHQETSPAGAKTVTSIADAYVTALARLDPHAAQALGRAPETLIRPYDPASVRARRDLAADTLRDLESSSPTEVTDERLHEAMVERLRSEVDLHDCGFTPGLVAPLATPAHDVLHSLQQAGPDLLAETFAVTPLALADIQDTLEQAAGEGYVVAPRQSRALAAQLRTWADPHGDDDVGVEARRLGERAARHGLVDDVRRAMTELADWLEQVHAPRGRDQDAVGAQFYSRTATAFLGDAIDPAETYAYGWERLAELTAYGTELAGRLGHDSIAQAEAALDADPAGRVPVSELVGWIERRIRAVKDQVAGRYFGWPDSPLARVEGHLGAPGSGAIYYSPPDPAGTRMARVVWSTPAGASDIPVWREVSTVHHEGIPGHHLQHVVTMTQEQLHPWQRHLCHVHGYAEGWAHYVEGRADSWGLLHDDAERLGVVLAQRWRAARIVVDLGLHVGEELGLTLPPDNGLTTASHWTPQVARKVLVAATGMDPGMARFEVDRYLGWPGQALAFCVGARLWEQARAQSLGEGPAPAHELAWHDHALGLGPMGLGPLQSALGMAG